MIGKYLSGWIYWKKLIVKYQISYHKIVIVLSGESGVLDQQVLIHLKEFMDRKRAKEALIIYSEASNIGELQLPSNCRYQLIEVLNGDIDKLYKYYCFTRFFENIVFTHIDTPKDNMLGKYLRETEINEEDAACLALYHLRYIP